MSDTNRVVPNPEPSTNGRPVGGTEHSWCKAVLGGTGLTVLALLFSRPPNFSLVQSAIDNLRNSHPIFRSELRFDPSSAAFSFATPPSARPFHLQTSDLHPTALDPSLPPLQAILELELNRNAWSDGEGRPIDGEVIVVTTYAVEGGKCAVAVRLHTGSCDRTAAVALLREVLRLMSGKEGAQGEIQRKEEVSLGIEDLVPEGKAHKPFWARGIDVLGYSLNSLRLANLGFCDGASPRRSEVVRLRLGLDDTRRLLEGCKSRGIKLCGPLSAAGIIAARAAKDFSGNRWEKYSVVTLMDCRSLLDPPLSAYHPGFYHSAIQNTHDINGEETLWDLATRTYNSFANSKNNNKHFSDMGDLNFLMCKAIENPGLTPSSSLRTCFVSVFEDSVIEHFNEMHRAVAVEDYMGCASVHGIGPSIAIFDTLRDGQLDCVCVYPGPLHSREQMHRLVDEMKRILCFDGDDEKQSPCLN